jgi:hypothetical protein
MSRSNRRKPPVQAPDEHVEAIDIVRWDYSSAKLHAGIATLRLHRPDGSMLDLLLTAEQEREIAIVLAEGYAKDLIDLYRSRGWV